MNSVGRALGLDHERWAQLTPLSLWPAIASVVAAFVLLAFVRFGSLAADAPRAFLRLMLVGVYGWLGLGVAIWVLGEVVRRATSPSSSVLPLHSMFAAVGLAHRPLVALGMVVLVAGGLFDLLGPGLVMAAFVAGFWFPAILVVSVAHVQSLSPIGAASVVALPYGLWLLTVGNHFHDRIQHLL